MRTIIIEDSDRELAKVKELLQVFPQIELVATASSVDDALVQVAAHRPQLLLLDVELEGGYTGFDLLQQLGSHACMVIFITAFDRYAVRAFRFTALDFLLKPIKPADMATALIKVQATMDKAIAEQQLQLQLEVMHDLLTKADRKQHRIALQVGNALRILYPHNIMYYESNGSYTHFFLSSGEKLITAQGLYQYQHLLDGYDFVKTSRQAVVNLAYVKNMKPQDGIHELTLLDGNTKLHVSRLCLDMVKDSILGHKKAR